MSEENPTGKFTDLNISELSRQKNPKLAEDFDFHMRYTYFRTKQYNGKGKDMENPIDTFKYKNNIEEE